MAEGTRRPPGIEVRHTSRCRSHEGGRCNCRPTYRAEAYDRRSGKRLRRSFPTLAAARAWRADAIGELRRGARRGPSATTVRQAWEAWIAGAEEGAVRTRSGDRFKPSTLRGYRAAMQARILPALGGARLADLARPDVQALADRMLAEGADPSTIRNAIMPLRVLYRRAVRDGVVAVNPCSGIELPAHRGRRDRIADPEEAARLLAALPEGDRATWATGLYAGLRAGELMALRWSDVDLAGGVVHVRRSYDPKGGGSFIDVKSRAGLRRVPLAAVLREHLVDHKLRTGGGDDALVFARPDGRPFDPAALRTRARRAWAAAGLAPITLHECRHTFASLMIAAGVNARALSAYMGHAGIAITLDRYGHLMPGNEDEAAGLLDAYLERADSAARRAALDG